MKLGQALYLNAEQILNTQPILLLDDIFDKLDSERVERIIQLVGDERFGQIFITDTDRQHLTKILSQEHFDANLFQVDNGEVNTLNHIQN